MFGITGEGIGRAPGMPGICGIGGAPAPEMSLGRFCGPIPGGGLGIAVRGGTGDEARSGCAFENAAKITQQSIGLRNVSARVPFTV
jgi:hypothetical protein